MFIHSLTNLESTMHCQWHLGLEFESRRHMQGTWYISYFMTHELSSGYALLRVLSMFWRQCLDSLLLTMVRLLYTL